MGQLIPFSPTALYQTRVVDPKTGIVDWAWAQHFQQASQVLQAPVSTQAPANSTAPAAVTKNNVPISSDGTYLYVATGPNEWKRIPLSAF